MWHSDFWALPLAVFIPCVLLLLGIRWAINSVLAAMRQISNQILSWHGSQESLDAHEKMWRKFVETDHFRDRLHEMVKHKIDHAVTPLNLRMDLLDKNMQIATANLAREVREQLEKFRSEVLLAITQRQDKD